MKKLLTLLVAAIITTVSFAQIQYEAPPYQKEIGTIGKINDRTTTYASLWYEIIGNDTICHFLFQTSIPYGPLSSASVGFKGTDTLNIFYNVLKSVFTDKHKKDRKYKVTFKLGTTEVVAGTVRSKGETTVRFSTPRGFVHLTEKQVDTIFGKI
jgi:hypothetical protein